MGGAAAPAAGVLSGTEDAGRRRGGKGCGSGDVHPGLATLRRLRHAEVLHYLALHHRLAPRSGPTETDAPHPAFAKR